MIWQDFEELLHISYPQLNNQYALNCISLGLGSIILVPLALKFGRRPIYLLTAIVILITAIWQAVLRDLPNMMAAQVFNGLACAVGWTLVPITVRISHYSLINMCFDIGNTDNRSILRASARTSKLNVSIDE